ncbi:MAG: crossover junction endodeoxyribonuclease RuvC [Dissulfurimicrobium sp.]|uniref:crossover junction endodeoxyribonuclease RuvC n=2 Tax=Dissulfurimicrobium TaxID=1769732 RepID=UPI003D09E75B
MSDGLILGIDPGSIATGYGIIKKDGDRLCFVDAGVIRPGCRRAQGDKDGNNLAKRLECIYAGLGKVIERLAPETSAIEGIFHKNNPRSALLLGHARGVAILAAVHRGLCVYEYSPMEIKKAVVGYGRAEKHQIQQMVKVMLNLQEKVAQDASDALAVAICHANSMRCRRMMVGISSRLNRR